MNYTALQNDGRRVRLEYAQEDYPECPISMWEEHAPIIACWHSRYTLGHADGMRRIQNLIRQSKLYKDSWEQDEFCTPTGGFYPNKHYLNLDDWHDLAAAALKASCIVKPVYLYDHSSLAVSLTNTKYPFTCPWDSGQVGLMVWSREQREHQHEGKFKNTRNVLQQDRQTMESLFNEWAQYIQGDVYRVTVCDLETDEEIDFCGDIYGWDYATGEALDLYFNIAPTTLAPLEKRKTA